jgi:flagellar basal body-associated protein FliL
MPKRRKKSLWNLLLVVPAFAVMGGISIGFVRLIQQFQSLRCPAETFLVGADQIALIFQVIPLLIGSIGLGFLIRLFFAAPKSDTIAAPQRDDAMGQQQTTVDFALRFCGPIPEFSCADLREQS